MRGVIKDYSKTIKVIVIVLIFLNIALLLLPVFVFTKTITLYNITETITIKASFLNILLNSSIDVVSSIGDSTIENIKIIELWFSEEQFNNVRVIIGILGANFIASLAVLAFSVVSNFTNKNHMWYFLTAWVVFFMVGVYSCLVSIPTYEELFYTLNFPVKEIIIYAIVNIAGVLIVEKLADKEKENAYNMFFDKYKKQSVEFQEELLGNFFECIGSARYDSSLEILSQMMDRAEKIPKTTKRKKKNQTEEEEE